MWSEPRGRVPSDPEDTHPERHAYILYDIGVLLPKLHHLLLAGSICLARLFGHHGDTSQRARGIGYPVRGADRALKQQEMPGTRPITPDGPLMHLN
uniref:Uncharacterized protein n=1 Tax=Hyaloperonospora arabidopsidis (strain Emoy2) TaxID=559515 RepID=M4BQK2_HYAAE